MSDAVDRRGPEKIFDDFLRAGRFMLQRERLTNRYVFYPRYATVQADPENLEWVEASGRGTVYATTVMRERPERGGNYNIVIVELAEGPRLMSTVEGLAPEDVCIGMAVVARIDSAGDTMRLVFHVAGTGSSNA
jgi:uncharacterized OB-fold protein